MNERNNKLELLGSAPIPKALMALGIPIMIGMLINALYNLVDALILNQRLLRKSRPPVLFAYDRMWFLWWHPDKEELA